MTVDRTTIFINDVQRIKVFGRDIDRRLLGLRDAQTGDCRQRQTTKEQDLSFQELRQSHVIKIILVLYQELIEALRAQSCYEYHPALEDSSSDYTGQLLFSSLWDYPVRIKDILPLLISA